MNLITVNAENLVKEHICCAISNNNDCQVASKKAWLSQRFAEGLVFLRGDVRGKCFIEYIPAENAWMPIAAAGYTVINCLWVSGQFKGQGNSTLLLDACIKDSKEKGRVGLCVLSAKKKMPFLSDPGFLRHKGFTVVDSIEPYYELYAFPFAASAVKPCFRESAKHPQVTEPGYVLYYSHQCPYTAKYVPLAEAVATEKGVPFKSILIETAQQAQSAPAPFTSYSLFYNGVFVTNEILSPNKFAAMIEAKRR